MAIPLLLLFGSVVLAVTVAGIVKVTLAIVTGFAISLSVSWYEDRNRGR